MPWFLHAQAQKEVFNAVYGDIAAAEILFEAPVRRYYEKRVLKAGLGPIDTSGMRCLDIGCGRGVFTDLLHDRFASVYGSDFAGRAVHTASVLLRKKGSLLTTADSAYLPFASASFDFVILKDILHHLERPVETIREARRVLKSGGFLLSIEPNNRNIPGLAIGLTMKHERRYLFVSPNFLVQRFRKERFRLCHSAFDGFFIPYGPLARLSGKWLKQLDRFENAMHSFFPQGGGHFIACYQKIEMLTASCVDC